MNDSCESSPKIPSGKVGAVIGAVIGSYFGPIGAGVGALAGHTLGEIYEGRSSEKIPCYRDSNGQQDLWPKSSPLSLDDQRSADNEVATCPHCGRDNLAGGLLCMYCGGRLPDMEDSQ